MHLGTAWLRKAPYLLPVKVESLSKRGQALALILYYIIQ
jgi:hypothetical protein